MLRKIKKGLMARNIRLFMSKHAMDRMKKRGYTKGDILSGIFSGRIVELQGKKVVISGYDKDNNPIVIVIAISKTDEYKVVTVMPPINKDRFPVIV